MFFDVSEMNSKSYCFEYDNLIEFEKLVFLYAFVREGKIENNEFKIHSNNHKISQVIINKYVSMTFNKNTIVFHEVSESGLYSLFQRIYNNTDDVLDRYVNEIMEDNYSSIPDDLLRHLNEFKDIKAENQLLYKYYSDEAIEDEETRKIKQGYITFTAPKKLNDPFECILFSVDKKMNKGIYGNINENCFRVFSCARDYNKQNQSGVENILMWAHYGESFKGYCFQYDYSSVLKTLKNVSINGKYIIISGNVQYDKEPKNIGLIPFRDTSFQKTVNSIFNKYEMWSYENEYRVVVISDAFVEKNSDKLKDEYFMVGPVNYGKVFVGANNSTFNQDQFRPCHQFYKVDADKLSCKLIVKEIEPTEKRKL